MSRIGKKILLLVFATIAISVGMATAAFLWLQFQTNIDERRKLVESTGFVFAAAIADHVEASDKEEILRVLRSITRVPAISYAAAVDGEGREIAGLGSTVVLSDSISDGGDGAASILNYGSFPVSVDIVRGGERVGRLVMVADISDFRSELLNAMMGTLAAALVAALIGLGLAVRLQRGITSPILSLTSAISRIRSQQCYNERVDHKSEDETGILVDAFNGMIGEIEARDAELERYAFFDGLTGLPNRHMFETRLFPAWRDSGQPAALLMFDIDGFKNVNETFGLSFGDGVLKAVSEIIRTEAPAGSAVACARSNRILILAPPIASRSEAEAALAPILASFYKPIQVQGREIYVDISTGIALLPEDGETSGEALRHAELALSSAKKLRIGRVEFFDRAVDKKVLERAEIAADLRSAISNRAFEAHYQPQVDLVTGAVQAFESLIRWKHPARGYIPPGLFIPVAEASGLITEIGNWVLEESCLQAKRWIAQGETPRAVSVNVSVAQILQGTFEAGLQRVLERTGLPPELLCLELTESLFAGSTRARTREVLSVADRLGVTLAIDDFGTGYSALAYLQDLPFHKLKIDRAFVSNTDHDLDKRKLLRGLIELAQALEMQTIAEGAETDGEVQVLIDLGVNAVQGYALGKPLPAGEALLAARAIPGAFQPRFRAQRATRAV